MMMIIMIIMMIIITTIITIITTTNTCKGNTRELIVAAGFTRPFSSILPASKLRHDCATYCCHTPL